MPQVPAILMWFCRRGRSQIAGFGLVLVGTLAIAAAPNDKPEPVEPRKQIEEVQSQQQKALEGLERAIQEAATNRVTPPAATGGSALANIRNTPNIRDQRFGKKGRSVSGPLLDDRLGLLVELPTPLLADQLDLPALQGVVVSAVLTQSPAAKAGLKPNDILLELNGQPVSSAFDEFARQIDALKADEAVEIVVLRKGRKETVKGLTLSGGAQVPILPAQTMTPKPEPIIPPVPPALVVADIPGLDKRGNALTSTVTRNGDQFTAHYRDGALLIVITGKFEEGKVKPDRITIVDGEVKTFANDEKVARQYKDRVHGLITTVGKNLKVKGR